MRLFIDTNIFLDLLFDRVFANEATMILNAIKEGLHEGFVSDITLLNIDYVAHKQSIDTRAFLSLIVEHFTILGANTAIFAQALTLPNDDLEDSVSALIAHEAQCEWIVTNDQTFYASLVPTISATAFVERFL